MKTVKFLKLAGVFGFGLMLAQGASAQSSVSNTPADFPVFKGTGNQEADAAAYEKMKMEYYSAHPEMLEARTAPALSVEEQNAQYEAEKTAAAAKADAARVSDSREVIPQEDLNNADAEKRAYILAHPELFIVTPSTK